MNWNKTNIISLSLLGRQNRVTCNVCHAEEFFGIREEYTTVKRPSIKTNGKTESTLKTGPAFLLWFQDWHYNEHVAKVAEAEKEEKSLV